VTKETVKKRNSSHKYHNLRCLWCFP